MLVIGHRGAAGLAPENTISSLQTAVAAGAQMVEADLRQTRDGELVMSHDATLLRTHDDRRKISDLTLREIKAIATRESRDLPTLPEFLQAATVPLNLELKGRGMESSVLSAISQFPHKVLLSSSLPPVLQKLRALDGRIPLGFIIGQRMGYLFPLMMAVAKKLDLYSIHPHHTLVTPARMQVMRQQGAKVFAWTVNSVHDYQLMKGFSVDGIFTDYPNIITQYGKDNGI